MKSIVYLSHSGDRPCKPVLVEHDPKFPAYEILKDEPRFADRLGLHYFGWRYVCTVSGDLSIHQKINCRALYISRTAEIRILHGRAVPPDWTDKRKVGRDYQWCDTPQRIARSRFRHWKRREKTRRGSTWAQGYACMDWSFGLYFGCGGSLNQWEREVIHERLNIAATSRAPLPPWSLNSAVDALLAREKAA